MLAAPYPAQPPPTERWGDPQSRLPFLPRRRRVLHFFGWLIPFAEHGGGCIFNAGGQCERRPGLRRGLFLGHRYRAVLGTEGTAALLNAEFPETAPLAARLPRTSPARWTWRWVIFRPK